MKTIKNSQSGFSLIELMVVVAIIGILATVAVPQVNKFMAKAKQSEAKASLSAIHTAEKAFFTEYNTYSAYFNLIGYSPEGRIRYEHGFAGVGTAVVPPGLTASGGFSTLTDRNNNAVAACSAAVLTVAAPFCRLPEAVSGGAPTTTLNTGDFIAQARSVLVTGAGVTDVWTINEFKQITQTSNGIP